MHPVHRWTCRVCQSAALTKVIDLGEQHLQGSFVRPGWQRPPLRRVATSLVRCDPLRDEKACGLLQMEYTVPPEVLHSVYWYRSGTNATMRDHLAGIAEEGTAPLGKPTARVLDIGCNDGTLLAAYPKAFVKYGIDPSDLAREVPAGITAVHELFPSEELVSTLAGAELDIITSIAMFCDLEDPLAFARAVKRLLTPEGIWCIEMSYMPTMLKMTSYDTICHEHLQPGRARAHPGRGGDATGERQPQLDQRSIRVCGPRTAPTSATVAKSSRATSRRRGIPPTESRRSLQRAQQPPQTRFVERRWHADAPATELDLEKSVGRDRAANAAALSPLSSHSRISRRCSSRPRRRRLLMPDTTPPLGSSQLRDFDERKCPNEDRPRVKAKLDTRLYPMGVEVADEAMDGLNITRDGFHGEWNTPSLPQFVVLRDQNNCRSGP
jgi:SAM-dependent methyltransferase